jgi:hypothetical protein
VYDAIYIEGKNKPTATFVFEHFANDAMSAASSKGMPVVRIVPEAIVSECTVVETIEAAIIAVFDNKSRPGGESRKIRRELFSRAIWKRSTGSSISEVGRTASPLFPPPRKL